MKTDPRRFAFLGPILSLLALLAFIGFLLVRGVVAAGLVTVDPDVIKNGLLISGMSIILGLALSAILDPEGARKFLVGRQVQYGSSSLISFLAFIGILIFVNVLAFQNPKTWDLTEDKTNTLAPETLNILNTLPQPVEARVYYTTRTYSTETQKLLDKFVQAGNEKFSYQQVDPELEVNAAKADGVERDGTIVLQMGQQKEQVTYPTEQELDAALLRLINPTSRVVYFVTGHGEPSLAEASDGAYTMLMGTLGKKNYSVNSLNLQGEGRVPQDASVVVVAGPRVPLAESEIQALKDFLAAGGAVIIMQEPQLLTDFGDSPDTLAGLLAEWGVAFNNDFVIDPNVNPASFAVSDSAAYAQHPITEKLLGLNTIFPSARSMTVNPAVEGMNVTPLVVTGFNAWGETDFASLDNNQVDYVEGQDLPGPLTLVTAIENVTNGGRMVVFGDSEFAADAFYSRGYGEILINAIDWAAEQENIISLTPKESRSRTFQTPGTLGFIGVVLASVCIIPLLVIAGGATAWFARRRRG